MAALDSPMRCFAPERANKSHQWLYTQDVVPILLSCLSPDRNWVVQTAAGDFIKAIITISANASQNEQQCIGPNELTRQLVSAPCVERLIGYMLSGGNPLTVGVGIVIEVIRKNNSDYDPDMGADEGSAPSCRDPIYLGTLLRLFAGHVPDFMRLIMHAPTAKQDIHSTFGNKIEPLGFDRFKTCELMAELLHCSNMGLMNEIGSEELIAARDAERHRLRGDGNLVPRREEDPSMEPEDVTMRFSSSHGAGGDEKHLKITNVAEDDGFEEVEHSREMNEDTSHEFVKAEEEIPPPVPIPSFFDKDEDELMDEPLSSPRLRIRDEELAEGFEEPDMVVAPLSPKKKAVAPEAPEVPQPLSCVSAGQGKEGDEKEKGEAQKDEAKTEGVKVEAETKSEEKDVPVSKQETKDEAPARVSVEEVPEGDDSDSSVVHTPATAGSHSEQETEPKEAEPKPAEQSTTEPEALESAQAKDESQVSTQAPPASTASDALVEKAADQTNKPSDATTPAPAAPALEDDVGPPTPPRPGTAKNDDDAGTESILIAAPDPPTNEKSTPVQPVVGDFLKVQFVEHKVVPTILVCTRSPGRLQLLAPPHAGQPLTAPQAFFFKYPWNNFLHNVVYDVVQQVFNGPMDRGYNPNLAVSLFESADVTNAIIRGQRASDESQAKTRTRMGYMGHLTLIAEEVVKFTERHPPELLSETVLERVMSQEWVSYVEGALAETRERDNAILGGVRPEMAVSNRAASMSGLAGVGLSSLGGSGLGGQGGASSALAEAGLNGNLEMEGGAGGMGPFAISAGTMMSGFGSSSDEEEDENEDAEEDINSEVSFGLG